MGILEFIEKLRTKPESERKKIAAMATFIIMVVIIAVWLAFFSLENRDSLSRSNAEEADSPIESLKKDALSFKESILNFYGEFKESINRFK